MRCTSPLKPIVQACLADAPSVTSSQRLDRIFTVTRTEPAGYPPSAIAAVNALHLIVPVIAAPFTAVVLIVNVPPAPAVVSVTFPDPATALSRSGFTVLTRYDLPPVTTLSETMSPDALLGRHRVSVIDRCPSLC